ncbi:MAG TPA: type II toxin-antitoxin system RelE/ParE family toxin [Thermoanaerobaculia bacterium]|jgi:mRNA interferase RelE/StbE|nr:type II toxin-antitoxin system RelE/ParE family toxin [Thermoanaerobaculia bacterium]
MAVRVQYKASVAGDLRRIDRSAAERILRQIEQRLSDPNRGGSPLSGEFAGLFRLRVGDYRVIYARRAAGVLVLRIAHRRDVYRRPTEVHEPVAEYGRVRRRTGRGELR